MTLGAAVIEERLEKLLDDLGDFIKESDRYIAPENKEKFERQIIKHLARYIDDVIAVTRACSNEHWQEVKSECQQLRLQAETLERSAELILPTSEEEVESTLWWMSARGTENDLSLLNELQKHPGYFSDERNALLSDTIDKIRERLEQGDLMLTQAEDAYQRRKDEWDQKYAGQYIAIQEGNVIDADTDKNKLIVRLLKKQRETGSVRAYIIQTENPALIAEEINDLESYLRHLPSNLRASGAFVAYEARLKRLQQQLARLQSIAPASGETT